ncbi:protein DMP6-like [Senna tora]|uniref:Protein DMP6-like n=1 Tax=Senna tora TaxID=362788 RepID=A0A834SG42_9FABA|nr:protein DMP6-like [Senna tora]
MEEDKVVFHDDDEEKLPLLRNKEVPEAERNLIQKAISQTFQSTAHLANLLPTGTVLAFQILSPIFSNLGECDSVSRVMTASLVALCGASCFLLCFTDSFRDSKGNVCYGFATSRGLWIIDGSTVLPSEVAARYRLRFIDFAHAFMSILVFAAIALFDQNVVSCFFPAPSRRTEEVLTALPVGIGVMCSMLFVTFPTQRHGIGTCTFLHKSKITTGVKDGAVMEEDKVVLHDDDEEKLPLLRNKEVPEAERNLIQKAISQTFQSTAHLANLLPTGTVLAFQILSPIFSNLGECDSVSRIMTASLVALCGASCFLLCFTDSFRDSKGNVCYGFATWRGLWIIDGSTELPSEVAAKYRLRFIDFAHAFMSILVFAAIALFDQNVVSCFFPAPSRRMEEVLTALPVGIDVMCSVLFVTFPTQRHGIGFPLSST